MLAYEYKSASDGHPCSLSSQIIKFLKDGLQVSYNYTSNRLPHITSAMRSSAIFQIISTMASLALITVPTGTAALPVRGALGNLGARARAAKRAAHYQAQLAAAAAEPVVEKRFKVAEPARPANVKKAKFNREAMEKREASLADSVLPASEQFKARAIQREFPNPKAFLVTGASSISDHVDHKADA